MMLVLTLLAASALAQGEAPPPPAPLPASDPYVNVVPDDQVPWEDQAAPEFPRVVRRDDQICTQSFSLDGQIVSQCRPGRFTKPAEATGGGSTVRFVASLGALGGMLALSNQTGAGVLGGFGGFGEIGARFTDWLGVVLVVNLMVGLTEGASLQQLAFAPGLRVGGDRVGLTVSLGPSLTFVQIPAGSAMAVMGNLLATGVFRVAGPLSLLAQAGLAFNDQGIIFTAGGGLGVHF